MSQDKAQDHIKAAFALWKKRSLVVWGLNLSMLTDAGISIMRPPSARERANVADQTMRQG
jgi:hypothetical protein